MLGLALLESHGLVVAGFALEFAGIGWPPPFVPAGTDRVRGFVSGLLVGAGLMLITVGLLR